MGDAILTVSGLSKRYGELLAVNDCSFEVERGSITGIIGPNGAGKSTTIDLVTGFTAADSGSVVFDGMEMRGKPPFAVARRGLMRTFQQSRGWPTLTVLENLLVAAPDDHRETIWRSFATPRRLRNAERRDRERARDLIELFGLGHMKNAPVRTLSGGQHRLVELARMMMAAPKMVVLDEPVASVNPVMSERIASSIARLPEMGATVLLVEHNLGFVSDICATVIVMAVGRVIAQAPMSELLGMQTVVDAYLGDVGVVAV